MSSVTNQDELLNLVSEIAENNPSIANDLNNLEYKLSDPAQIAQRLASAQNYQEIQECVSLEKPQAEQLCKILNQSILGSVFGKAAETVSTEKEQFYNLQGIELPVYDPNTSTLPLTTYKLKCGLDIFNCALRLFMKSDQFYPGQMQIVHTEAKTMIKFKVPIKHDLGDDEVEEKTYRMFVEVQCYQHPELENVMLVAVRKKDQNFTTTEAFSEFCDKLFLKFALRVFVIADAPTGEEEEEEN